MERKTPCALVFITFVHSSSGVSAIVLKELTNVPALLKAMSIRPYFFTQPLMKGSVTKEYYERAFVVNSLSVRKRE
jgi:hypothetical protein